LQPVFSFKLRGAYSKLVNLPEAARKKGVIARHRPATTRKGQRWLRRA
jgi:hypothetical protein